MAEILLVHVVSPLKVSAAALPGVLADIIANRRLACGAGAHGYGVYAWFAGEVPPTRRGLPAVVFTVDAARVRREYFMGQAMAFLQEVLREVYLPVRVLGLLSAPATFPTYAGPDPF
jgi:hypothetical protein